MSKCKWYFYTNYYETDCSSQIEEEDFELIQPTFCPFCGGKIDIENA